MWRAWGTLLLLLSQDLGPPVEREDHEFSFRPPAGWEVRPGQAPTVLRWHHAGAAGKVDGELLLTHLRSSNPTPLPGLREQAKEHFKERFPESKLVEDAAAEVGGRSAHRLAWTNKGLLHLKVAVRRSNLEWYILDGILEEGAAAKLRPVVDAAAATFKIVPAPLSADEKAAFGRFLGVLGSAKADPGLFGERWYMILLGGRKAGHQRLKVGASEGLIAFELDVHLDLGDGNRDVSTVRGSFSPDCRVQRLESEQVKENDKKEKWVFRASATLEGGRVRALRDMNGTKEEGTFPVEEGTVLVDVHEVVRSFLVAAGKGTYFVRTLNPFVEDTTPELIEVASPEALRIDGAERETVMVQSRIDRRKTMTYAYGTDRRLYRLGGPQDLFVVLASTREEALRKPEPPPK
jgi:hypothetical protein